MISIPQEADPVFIGTTHFVMVARNKNGRASAVHPILSKNPEVCTVSASIFDPLPCTSLSNTRRHISTKRFTRKAKNAITSVVHVLALPLNTPHL